jgi:hypothetical protein
MKAFVKSLITLALLVSACAMAAPPQPGKALALCAQSANLLACHDAEGNAYSVATAGKTLWLRGYEAGSKRRWVQTNSRYGQLTFFSGLASDGEAWIGTIQRVGWTTISRVSSSSGTRTRIMCSRVTGCHQG